MTDDPRQHGPLDYRDPREDAPPSKFVPQALGCAVLVAVSLVAMVAALLYFAFSMDYRGVRQPSGTAGTITAGVIGLAIIVALLVLAQRCYADPKTRAWAFGIWIGIGMAISVEGACFMLRR